MKTKTPASTKKQNVAVKDLKTKKNPKGGGGITISGTKTGRARF
ncbi:MAG: hypothetical protein Q7S40_33500 [Opitutaceae bacterium]|nr:hypothetical protein [Opitutaceae bacterium]